jgi:hypothetical protein
MLEVGHGVGLFDIASALVLAFSITINVSTYSSLSNVLFYSIY